MNHGRHAPIVYVSDRLAQETARFLVSFADRRPSEGVVYWFGMELGPRAVVTTLVVPDADTTEGSVITSAAANADVVRRMVGTPLIYLGQAHSHPGSSVMHSSVDDTETFARFEGALSIVVPWFGRYGLDLNTCGVHRHLGGRFRSVRNVDEHVRILPGVLDLRLPDSDPDSDV